MNGTLPQNLDEISRSLDSDPGNPVRWIECGIVLRRLGQEQKAEMCFQQAHALDPNSVRALFNLGNLARGRGDLEQAAALYQEACRLDDGHAEVWNNLGLALQALNHPEKALDCFWRAVSLQPRNAPLWANAGNALLEQALPDDAAAAYARSLELDPGQAEVHHSFALALLGRGDYARGWEEFEWRLRCPATAGLIGARDFPRPRWDGAPLEGKRLLIYAEQGLGDTIQFARFLPRAARQGGRILFACYPTLINLCRSLGGVESLVDVTAPALPGFEYYAPLMSLPHLLHLGPEDLAAPVPYLHPSAPLPPPALGRLGPGTFNVGLAWASNTENRLAAAKSLPLQALAPLASIAGVQWFSLQFGRAAEEGRHPGAPFRLKEPIRENDTMDATAALIGKLDLVITIDTSVAHLAGALGKPVWTLLPFAADWRWLREGHATRWYPTMQLFRQRRRGDWSGPVEELAALLQKTVPR